MRWSRWVQAGLTGVGALGASSLALAPGTSLPGAAHAQAVVELLPEEPVPPGYATQSMFVICNPESILSERAVPGPLYSIFVPICCPIRVQKNVRSVRTHFRSTVRVWRKVVHLAPNCNRAPVYREIWRWFDRQKRVGYTPDQTRDEMMQRLHTLRGWIEEARSSRRGNELEVAGGGALTTLSVAGLLSCPETAGLGCLVPAAVAVAGGDGMTAKSMNDFANSDANVNRLLRQIAEQRRRINDRDISLQRPINDLLHQAICFAR